MSLTVNLEHHNKTKHIAITWHYVREQVQERFIRMMYLHTTNMSTDDLTKSLHGLKLSRFVHLLILSTLQNSFTMNLKTGGRCQDLSPLVL